MQFFVDSVTDEFASEGVVLWFNATVILSRPLSKLQTVSILRKHCHHLKQFHEDCDTLARHYFDQVETDFFNASL